jgi:DNA-binding CsgD family transcriptional regulator
VTPDDKRLLAGFGVSASSETVWRALIARPQSSSEELTEASGLAGEQLADAIDSLLAAGLLRGEATTLGVVAVDPALALETHMVRAERQVAEQAESFAAVRARLPFLASDFARARATSGDVPSLEVVVPLEEIRGEISRAADRVQSELRSIDHLPGETYEGAMDIDVGVLRRGVRNRLITSTSFLTDPGALAYFEAAQRHGHETRTIADISTRVMIFDHELALLPVDPTNMPLGAIAVRARSLIDLLILMYDQMWTVATPFFATTSDSATPIGRRARVLELLAVGTKDEKIARTLDIGVRTVRREVADLKASLNVNSRAEIAAAAMRKGWL